MNQLYRVMLLVVILAISLTANAQVGIGTTTPDPSAQLEIASPSKGLLIPRVASVASVTGSIAEGLLVYQTGTPAGFYLRQGGAWIRLATTQDGGSIIPFASGLPITMTTVFGGVLNTGSLVGFGNSTGAIVVGPSIDLTAVGNFAFSTPRDGIITSMSAFFNNTIAITSGSFITITAQLYQSTPIGNLFNIIPGAAVILNPLGPFINVGDSSYGTVTGLNIPVTAGSRLMLVFSCTDSNGGISTVNGYASAGVNIN